MVSKKNRISHRAFTSIFNGGKKTHTPYILHIYRQAETVRLAVVVPKKVHKSAVKRNKLRRQLYHVLLQKGLPLGHHIFFVKPNIKDLAYLELTKHIDETVGRMHYSR